MIRWRCKEYLMWVASLPCARCKREGASQAHHIKGIGQMSGASLKAPDHWSMPLCQECHDLVHDNLDRAMLQKQYEWVARTLVLYFDLMIEGLGPDSMRTMVKGIGRVDVIGG